MSDFNKVFRSRNYGGHLNHFWVESHLPRYQLAYGALFTDSTSFAHLRSPGRVELKSKTKNFEWLKLLNYNYTQKILLHSNSGKFLQYPSSSAVTDLAFSTITLQSRIPVYSRKSVAGFKLAKGSLLGAKVTLRSLKKDEFFYKLYFLAAAAKQVPLLPARDINDQPGTSSTSGLVLSFSVQNVFIFNELDSLDYDSFSNMPGLEIQFIRQN